MLAFAISGLVAGQPTWVMWRDGQAVTHSAEFQHRLEVVLMENEPIAATVTGPSFDPGLDEHPNAMLTLLQPFDEIETVVGDFPDYEGEPPEGETPPGDTDDVVY